jgi:hypothetical protein
MGIHRNANLYHQIVGSMMHAVVYACPDIAFVADKLSQYNVDPSAAHIHTAKCLLRNLKGSIKTGIIFSTEIGDLMPIAYADTS